MNQNNDKKLNTRCKSSINIYNHFQELKKTYARPQTLIQQSRPQTERFKELTAPIKCEIFPKPVKAIYNISRQNSGFVSNQAKSTYPQTQNSVFLPNPIVKDHNFKYVAQIITTDKTLPSIDLLVSLCRLHNLSLSALITQLQNHLQNLLKVPQQMQLQNQLYDYYVKFWNALQVMNGKLPKKDRKEILRNGRNIVKPFKRIIKKFPDQQHLKLNNLDKRAF